METTKTITKGNDQLTYDLVALVEHDPADTTPEEIYGKHGSMGHLFNVPFATRADLQEALAQNHGGGVQMEVIEALAGLCGPRVEGARSS
jgi:hypothetical protein